MNQIVKKRIYCFDLLKLFSIFYVFVYHIYMDMYVIHPMHNLKLIEDITIRPNMHFAMIACGLFIFISGATLTFSNINRDINPIEFYKKRLIRVLIPFYIAYIIYFIIKVITLKNIHIYGGVPKWQFIWTILGLDEYLNAAGIKTFSLGVGEWFLGCIILCYLAYPFLYNAHKKNKILTFIVMTIYYLLININYGKLNTTMPVHFNFLCQVYNFYLGIAFVGVMDEAVEVKNEVVGAKHRDPLWLLIITLPIILFFYFYKQVINIPDNFKTTIVVVSIIITFYMFENAIANNNLLKKVIPLFNIISYEFFLVHHFVIYQIDFMLNYRKLSGVETLLVIVVDLLVTILLAIVVNKISRQIMKLLH